MMKTEEERHFISSIFDSSFYQNYQNSLYTAYTCLQNYRDVWNVFAAKQSIFVIVCNMANRPLLQIPRHNFVSQLQPIPTGSAWKLYSRRTLLY